MITLRILPPAELARRKRELEARDGTKLSPELLALAKRLSRVDKMRAATIKRLQKRGKKA